MPSNADVNVIPAKMTTSGDAAGYVKINDNNFEIVSQIPVTDTSLVTTYVQPSSYSGDTPSTDNRSGWGFFTIPAIMRTIISIRLRQSNSLANKFAFNISDTPLSGSTRRVYGYWHYDTSKTRDFEPTDYEFVITYS